jgi:hypothetical protein
LGNITRVDTQTKNIVKTQETNQVSAELAGYDGIGLLEREIYNMF